MLLYTLVSRQSVNYSILYCFLCKLINLYFICVSHYPQIATTLVSSSKAHVTQYPLLILQKQRNEISQLPTA